MVATKALDSNRCMVDEAWIPMSPHGVIQFGDTEARMAFLEPNHSLRNVNDNYNRNANINAHANHNANDDANANANANDNADAIRIQHASDHANAHANTNAKLEC